MINRFLFYLCSIVLLLLFVKNNAQSSSPSAPPGPTNITQIFEKAGQFTTFIRLLGTTQMGSQINTQLNNSNQGMTIFAPTDNAFSSLKAGTLNSLSDQEKVELLQFHVIPTFLSMSQFQTVSNPLRTQAGNSDPGQFPLNITTSGNQVNVSTGVIDATVANTIYTDSQLAVYQVDKVLLPLGIFASSSPAPAPAPGLATSTKKTPVADSPRSSADNGPENASGASGLTLHGVLVSFVVAAIAAVCL